MGQIFGFVFVAACLYVLNEVGYKLTLLNMFIASIVIIPVGACTRLIFDFFLIGIGYKGSL